MVRQHPLLVLLLSVLLTDVAAQPSEWSPYLQLESFSVSEPVSIHEVSREWGGDFSGGNNILSLNRIEAGARSGPWSLATFYRHDSQLHASEETMELYHRVKNHLPLDPGRRYRVDPEMFHLEASGVTVGYRFKPTESSGVAISLSYLDAYGLRDGSVNGWADATTAMDYDFLFSVDDYYSSNALFDRDKVNPYNEPSGKGVAVDMEWQWIPSEGVDISLSASDLFGWVDWNSAPYTVASAQSDTKSYDADGYVRYDPVVSGVEGEKNYRQDLPLHLRLVAGIEIHPEVEARASMLKTKFTEFTDLELAWSPQSEQEYLFGYGATSGSVMLGYAGKTGGFQLMSDSLDMSGAHTQAVTAWMRFEL